MSKDEAELIYYTKTVDADGFTVQTVEVSHLVDVDLVSVSMNEVYAAMQADRNPLRRFKMRAIDWELSKHTVDSKARYAEKIRYDGSVYDVIRDYTTNGYTEVTCG